MCFAHTLVLKLLGGVEQDGCTMSKKNRSNTSHLSDKIRQEAPEAKVDMKNREDVDKSYDANFEVIAPAVVKLD